MSPPQVIRCSTCAQAGNAKEIGDNTKHTSQLSKKHQKLCRNFRHRPQDLAASDKTGLSSIAGS